MSDKDKNRCIKLDALKQLECYVHDLKYNNHITVKAKDDILLYINQIKELI